MGNPGNRLAAGLAVVAMCGVGSMNTALASPPARRPPLDLQPPVMAEKPSETFPSMHRHTLATAEQNRWPGSSTEVAQARTPGRVEELVRRFHREGLPVARLWENKSALLSLGLNQRGKPGLWLIQKVH